MSVCFVSFRFVSFRFAASRNTCTFVFTNLNLCRFQVPTVQVQTFYLQDGEEQSRALHSSDSQRRALEPLRAKPACPAYSDPIALEVVEASAAYLSPRKACSGTLLSIRPSLAASDPFPEYSSRLTSHFTSGSSAWCFLTQLRCSDAALFGKKKKKKKNLRLSGVSSQHESWKRSFCKKLGTRLVTARLPLPSKRW